MERRFEERKREIEQDAHIDKQALAGCVRQLQQLGKPYFAHFLRSEIVPSKSTTASSKNDFDCFAQMFSHTLLIWSCKQSICVAVYLRQKSPAVVGSGIECVLSISRCVGSCRRYSICSRAVPPQRKL